MVSKWGQNLNCWMNPINALLKIFIFDLLTYWSASFVFIPFRGEIVNIATSMCHVIGHVLFHFTLFFESVVTVAMSDSCLPLKSKLSFRLLSMFPIGAHYYAYIYCIREHQILQHNQFGTWHTFVQQPTSYDSVWLLTGMWEGASYFESFSEMIYI